MKEETLMDRVQKYRVSVSSEDGSRPPSPVGDAAKPSQSPSCSRSRSCSTEEGSSPPPASYSRKEKSCFSVPTGSRSNDGSHHKTRERRPSRSPRRKERSGSREQKSSKFNKERSFPADSRPRPKRSHSGSPPRDKRSRHRSRSKDRSRGLDKRRSRETDSSPSRGKDRERKFERGLRRRSRSSERRYARDVDRYRHRSPDRRSPKRRMKEHLVQQAAARQTQEALELASKLNEVSNVAGELEKPSKLPLNDMPTGQITPQILLQQTMALMNAKTQALTGVALPKYYNIAAVNPLKYAEQIQKRKLLWQGSKEKAQNIEAKEAAATAAAAAAPPTAHWEKATFSQDQDGKMTAKFRKLMGIKDEPGETSTQATNPDSASVNQQETLFRDLDLQYEVARMSTHTHRGVGLGYSSHALPIFPK